MHSVFVGSARDHKQTHVVGDNEPRALVGVSSSSDKIANLDFLEHYCTFPRQARLLALFFLSGWRPAPERERAATAIMLRRFGFFILVRFAILALKVVNSFASQQNLAKRTQRKIPTMQVLITCA